MSESVVIIEIVVNDGCVNDLFKFSTLKEVDVFCKELKKGTKVKIYIPNQIHTTEVN